MKSPVLFVSPDREAARKLTGILEQLPVTVDHVANLAQANGRARDERYRVVVTEAELPDGTWRDILRMCAGLDANPPVLVTSVHADSRLWVEALEAGASDVLAQPFGRSEVARSISAVIGEVTAGAAA